MKARYRLFRRGNVYWAQDNETGKQISLKTKLKTVAQRLLRAKNEAFEQPQLNLQIAVLGKNIVAAGLQRVTYSCLEQGNWRMLGE